MTTEPIAATKANYRHLYNFLLVLNEEQITKLRSIVVGTRDLTAFSETEIRDLESKLKKREQ